jgi:restriction system protein
MSAIKPGEKGLFVCTGGFSKDAKRFAMDAPVPLTLVDGEKFTELLMEFYENLDPEYKSMIPLKKIYIPLKLEA